MNFFEYEYLELDSPLTTAALNSRGADRWELVGFAIRDAGGFTPRYCYIFQRGKLR